MLRLLIAILFAGFVTSSAVLSQTRSAEPMTDKSFPRDQNVRGDKRKEKITFRPPLRGAPTRRIGGASRSPGVPSVSLVVFASEDTGLTIHAQPSLYWFLSKKTDRPIELTLIDPKAIQPVLKTVLDGSNESGLHEISLAVYGVELNPNVEYEWAVSLVIEPRRRSRDVVSSGTIRRILPAPGMNYRFDQLSETARGRFYARSGLWYDAMAAVSRAIARHPADRSLREERASLLRQVGLSDYIDLVDGQ